MSNLIEMRRDRKDNRTRHEEKRKRIQFSFTRLTIARTFHLLSINLLLDLIFFKQTQSNISNCISARLCLNSHERTIHLSVWFPFEQRESMTNYIINIIYQNEYFVTIVSGNNYLSSSPVIN